MKKPILIFVLLIFVLVVNLSLSMAQTTDTAQSTVAIFYVACEGQGVIELSGEMLSGYDVFFQLYSGPSGTGVPLSSLRQVQVNGSFTFSEVVPYSSGATVPAGSVGSAFVSIARESDSSRTVYETTVNDLQDGCAEPQTAPGTSTDLEADSAEDTTAAAATPGSNIISPFGGVVNPGFEPEPAVKIGARRPIQRSTTPGLLFALCDQIPAANPGLLYDTDELTVFWSWFAKTPEQVQDHVDHAQYAVFLNGQVFPYVERTEIQRIKGDYWVFYIARIGDSWRPGVHGVSYTLTWDAPISDGYADYGPGTGNEREYGTCTFEIKPNPWGIPVSYSAPPIPDPNK